MYKSCVFASSGHNCSQPLEHCNKKQLTKETHSVSETGLAKRNKQFLSELYGHSKRKTLDVQTHYKPTETIQHTHFSSSHPLSIKKGFIKREISRLLRTNSVKEIFELRKLEFLTCLLERGYPRELAENILAQVKFLSRNEALQNKTETSTNVLPFITTFNPAKPNLKKVLMKRWHFITESNRLGQIYSEPPIVAYRKDKSFKDLLVRAKNPSHI